MKDYLKFEKDPLEDPLIRSYYQSNMDLARTIAIKSVRSADAQNNTLVEIYGHEAVNFLSPITWKYYLNLAGLYHPTDSEITITSLDTLELISFNQQTLSNHPNTLKEYQYGTSYYRTLVNQYPDQEDLIMGILMPCDLQFAIAAEEGTILRFSKTLVEEHEYSLIYDLQEACKRHIFRWYVDAYRITENYSLMSYYSILYLFMITKLFNLRDARRNTYEAHSFHVRMCLRGYMGIDKYFPFMNRQQAMYLYRNLPRLVRYMGYDSQFTELMANILSPRDIQMLGYIVRQTNQIDGDYTPVTIIRSDALNKVNIEAITETLTPAQLFQKEQTVLYGTVDYYDAYINETILDIKRQNQSKVLTKDVATQQQLEVGIYSLRIEDIELSHWGYMSAVESYTAMVTFDNPRTGVQQSISAKTAFIYMQYLIFTYTSTDLVSDLTKTLQANDLAQLIALNRLLVKRNVTVLPFFLSHSHITNSLLNAESLLTLVDADYRDRMRPTAEALVDKIVLLSICNTPELFHELCDTIFQAYNQQHEIASLHTDPVARGYARNMVYKLYQDTMVSLVAPGTTVDGFLTSNNLDSYETSGEYVSQLVANIYFAGTGSSQNSAADQKNTVRALLGVLRSLTSYNIQFIDQISETRLTSVQVEAPSVYGRTIGSADGSSYFTNHDVVRLGVSVQDVATIYF